MRNYRLYDKVKGEYVEYEYIQNSYLTLALAQEGRYYLLKPPTTITDIQIHLFIGDTFKRNITE